MSTTSEKANLARIRDNQRRSRARRKEYLQELEARLRQCELQGIEASSEIQMAARRVADENKKLRGLLAQHGFADDTIEAYLQTSPTTDVLAGNLYATSSSAAVQLLEQLLQTRKTVCADTSIPITTQVRSGSRDSSASVATVQSMWDPIYSRPGPILQTRKAASSIHQFATPTTSIASRKSSSVSLGHASHQQRLTSTQMPRSPVSNPSNQIQHQHPFDFDPQLSGTNSYSSQQPQLHKHLQSHSGAQGSSAYMADPPRNTNVNNCNYATDMITAMSGGGDPNSVRSELGCLPGMDCDVDNHHLFEVMDRYSGVRL